MNSVKGRTLFISIQNKNFFNSSHGLIVKLKNSKPQNCLISMDIGKSVFYQLKNNILRFLRTLKDNNIKFTITKPIPLLDSSGQTLFNHTPKNCEDCYELFKVSNNGEIELCTGRKLFKEHYVDNRSLIYNFFIKLGILGLEGERTKFSCPNFPKDKESFQLLGKRYDKGVHYINRAHEYFSDGNIKKCIKYINKAITLDCRQGKIHLLLGFCNEKNKQYERKNKGKRKTNNTDKALILKFKIF